MLMIATDLVIIATVIVYALVLARFIRLARFNVDHHPNDVVARQHFSEHFLAASVAFAGTATTTVFSVLHLIGQDILQVPLVNIEQIEMWRNISMSVLVFGSVMFALHMISEETPGHQFYIREYGEESQGWPKQ